MNQRSAEHDGFLDCNDRIDVVHNAADIGRQHFGIDLAARDRVDHAALGAFRILGLHHGHAHAALALHGFFHDLDCLWLVVLDTDHALRLVEQLQNALKTFHDLFRILEHAAIVRCQIRLTLRAVHQHVLYLLRRLRSQFDVRRETGAAHADHTGRLDPFQDRVAVQLIKRSDRIIRDTLILLVVLDDDRVHKITDRVFAFFNCLHRTGDRCVHRCGNKTARFGDLLSGKHTIPLGHTRLCGSSDML